MLIFFAALACTPISSIGPSPKFSKQTAEVTGQGNSGTGLPAHGTPVVYPISFSSCFSLSPETGLGGMGYLKTMTFLTSTKVQTIEQFKGATDCNRPLTDNQIDKLILSEADTIFDTAAGVPVMSTPRSAADKEALKKIFVDGVLSPGLWASTQATGLSGNIDLGSGNNALFHTFKKFADGRKLTLSVVCTKIDSDSGFCSTLSGTTKENRSTNFKDANEFDRVDP